MSLIPLNRRTDPSIAAGAEGFTLIEVMISIIILAFISLGIYQATTEAYHLRDVLSTEGEFYNGIRLATDILGRDIAAMYSPALMQAPAPTPSNQPVNQYQPPVVDPEMAAVLQTDAGRTTQFWLPAIEKTGLRPSHFIGTENKLSFVSLSHVRIYRDSPESVFAKVSYALVPGEDPQLPDTWILVKTESTNAFDDDDRRDREHQHKYPLLHGIKKMRLRYWSKEREKQGRGWQTSWDNEKEDFKEKYPDIIEVQLEVIGTQKLSFDAVYRFRPEVPLRGLDPSS